jgi:uncharacterized protein YcgL (UPF0745 family)
MEKSSLKDISFDDFTFKCQMISELESDKDKITYLYLFCSKLKELPNKITNIFGDEKYIRHWKLVFVNKYDVYIVELDINDNRKIIPQKCSYRNIPKEIDDKFKNHTISFLVRFELSDHNLIFKIADKNPINNQTYHLETLNCQHWVNQYLFEFGLQDIAKHLFKETLNQTGSKIINKIANKYNISDDNKNKTDCKII